MNLSMTLSIFGVRPSAVVSNWESVAQMAFGWIGDIAPTVTPMPEPQNVSLGGQPSLCSA